jgi:hypothetical protein
MATLTVTTGQDIVAADGELSLREAVNLAGKGDTIVFDRVIPFDVNCILKTPLVIGTGKVLTIDGRGGGYNQFDAGGITGQVVIEAGADVTLRELFISTGIRYGLSSPNDGAIGDRGDNGSSGLNGTTQNQPGSRGGDGMAGKIGKRSSANALGILGAIQNKGRLTLDYVEVSGGAFSGSGALGGRGGNGGNGGGGGSGLGSGNGADAGAGGKGGGGADGTDGADALAGIWNTGTLTLRNVLVTGNSAIGGRGGDGGVGGDGGYGGNGGNGGVGSFSSLGGNGGNGGRGGDGGSGGAGGDGGSAVAGLLNEGRLKVVGAAAFYDNEAEAGEAGLGGAGGAGQAASDVAGRPGSGGVGGFSGLPGGDGDDGAEGLEGRPGSAIVGVAGGGPIQGAVSFDARFYAFRLGATPLSAQTLYNGNASFISFENRVASYGDGAREGSVGWGLVPKSGVLKASDFIGDALPSGRLPFGIGSIGRFATQNISFQFKAGVVLPKDVTFDIVLRSPQQGDALGTDTTIPVKLIRAGDGADRITGTDLDRTSDDLNGFGGNDRINALRGNDYLSGGLGDDTLIGGIGKDQLTGGAGVDQLSGGKDGDRFIFGQASDSTTKASDLITDFSSADGDRLLLSFDADTRADGFQSFVLRGGRSFTGTAGELRSTYDRANDVTVLLGDLNRDRKADFSLSLAGQVPLTAGLFANF